MYWPLIILVLSYLSIVFPRAYFRHDDWLILGNAVMHVAKDWVFAFSPTLFYAKQEVVWFFRPFFKFGVLVFYWFFGFNYYLWLCALLAFLVGALFFAVKTLELISSKKRASFFIILFSSLIYVHLGSLVWMGEGMMNCPQLFFLSLSTYLFVRAVKGSRVALGLYFSSLLCFVISLGFKESAVFHCAFLAAIVFSEACFNGHAFKKKLIWLVPFILLTAIYLIVRLKMPFNDSYRPHFRVAFFTWPLFFIGSIPVCIMACTYLFLPGKRKLHSLFIQLNGARAIYLGFLAFSVLPFFGHGFFSVGWYLLPGFYFTWVFARIEPSLDSYLVEKKFWMMGLSLFLLTLGPVLWRLNYVGWWRWSEPQRRIEEIVQSASPEKTKRAFILDCPDEKYPHVRLNEVIGFDAGLYFLWALHKPNPIQFHVISCTALQDHPEAYYDDGSDLILKWQFPDITVVRGASEQLALR